MAMWLTNRASVSLSLPGAERELTLSVHRDAAACGGAEARRPSGLWGAWHEGDRKHRHLPQQQAGMAGGWEEFFPHPREI